MKRTIFCLLFLVKISFVFTQTIIQLEKTNGLYTVPCKVNGIPMNFIFDTGASNVTISLTEAAFLIKQGLLRESDIKESIKYQIANGDINEGTSIILREIEVAGYKIENIAATVVHEQNAPLLLGQSALSKLGSIKIEDDQLIIEKTKVVSEFENEILDAFKFVNKYLALSSITTESLQITNEFFELRPVEQEGFAVFGLTSTIKEEQEVVSFFILNLDNVQKVTFENINDDNTTDNLVFVAEENSDGFVLMRDEKFYRTYKLSLDVCCTNAKDRTRILKAISHMLENNQKHIDKTQKF
jgi:clan AA aspartic protease (TIGR02281 family)